MDPALRALNVNQIMSGPPSQGMAPEMPAPMPIPQMSGDPISSGTMAAMRARKQSIGMDEDDKRRALGMAIFQFGANMGKSQRPSRLGAMNESLTPAIMAYMNERTRAEGSNRDLLEDVEKQQREAQKEELKKQERMEDLAIKREMIAAKNGLKAPIENMSGLEGATPMQNLSQNERKLERTRLNQSVYDGNEAHKGMRTADRMIELVKNNPQLHTSFARLWNLPPGESDSMAKQLMRNMTNEKDRKAFQEYNKLRPELISKEIKSAPAKVMTDIHKHTIDRMTVDQFMDPEVQIRLLTTMRNDYKSLYDYGRNSRTALQKGVTIAPYIYEEPEENNAEMSEENVPRGTQNQGAIIDVVQKHRALNPDDANVPDKIIAEFYRKHPDKVPR